MTSYHPPLEKKVDLATVRGLAKSPPTVHSNCSERARKDHFGCPGELFRVGQENRNRSNSELAVRFLFLLLLPTPPPKREYNAVSAVADEVW